MSVYCIKYKSDEDETRGGRDENIDEKGQERDGRVGMYREEATAMASASTLARSAQERESAYDARAVLVVFRLQVRQGED